VSSRGAGLAEANVLVRSIDPDDDWAWFVTVGDLVAYLEQAAPSRR
jgi:hypothetical protein